MLTYEQHGKVAHLLLDDGKANAVGHDFIAAVNEGLDKAQADADACVLQGRDGKFSAGFDLTEIQKGPTYASALVGKGAQMLLRMFTFPQPLVAACSGHAVAAGAFMLLACDTRIGIEGNFKLGLNETAIGMTLPEFGHQLAVSRLLPSALTASYIQAQLFSPQDAAAIGFLDKVVAPADLQTSALEAATALAQLPGQAYAANELDIRRDAIAAIRSSLHD